MNMKRDNESAMSCYTNGREQLYDELTKLDILIHLQVLRFRDRNPQKKTAAKAYRDSLLMTMRLTG
ncbi:MAG: hypothetical protein GY765_08885 [bacterium]|nr:hypothetical protein [bacterium]